jgi:hypothetical protein
MKLVITIDLPDEQVDLAPAIEDRVLDCVQRFSASLHARFGVYGSRLFSDLLYAEYRDRLLGPKPSGQEWGRWFARASTLEDP